MIETNVDNVQTDSRGYRYLRRKDGSAILITAWFLGALALLCAFLVALDGDAWQLQLLGGVAAGLWLVLFVTGMVVRALYFLAGDSSKPRSWSS